MRIVFAVLIGVMIWKAGTKMLGGMIRPAPTNPEGEMRRVNLRYRCPSCGTEIRMTKTVSDDPAPPRHCMDEMDLVARDGEAL